MLPEVDVLRFHTESILLGGKVAFWMQNQVVIGLTMD
jgi:hypothetical protein